MEIAGAGIIAKPRPGLQNLFARRRRQRFDRRPQVYAFAYADLITQWPAIVGETLAQWSEPERIKWPRAGAGERKQGGTLVIRVVPGRGLDLQHQTPQIIDRINSFYGYCAITSVKIM